MLALQYAEIFPVTVVFLQAKHRERFFQLMDVFLSSNLVPAYTVAAFAKRFARLSLAAPPAGVCYPMALACMVPRLDAPPSIIACAGLHDTLQDLVHQHTQSSVLGLLCMAYVAVCACRCHDCNCVSCTICCAGILPVPCCCTHRPPQLQWHRLPRQIATAAH